MLRRLKQARDVLVGGSSDGGGGGGGNGNSSDDEVDWGLRDA